MEMITKNMGSSWRSGLDLLWRFAVCFIVISMFINIIPTTSLMTIIFSFIISYLWGRSAIKQ